MNTIQRIILLVILIVLPTALSAKGVEIKGKSADVEKAGADIVVMGSAVYKADNKANFIKNIKDLAVK